MAWRRAPSPLQQPAAPTGVAAGSPLGAEARRASLTWDRGAPSGAWRRAERGRSSARLSGAVALAAKPSKRGAFVISKYVFLSTLTNSNSRSQITSCRISRTEFSCQVLKFPPGRLSSHRRSPVMPLPPTSALDPMHCSMLAQKSHCAGSAVNGSHSPHRTPPTPGEAVTSLMPQLSLPTATAAGGGGVHTACLPAPSPAGPDALAAWGLALCPLACSPRGPCSPVVGLSGKQQPQSLT